MMTPLPQFWGVIDYPLNVRIVGPVFGMRASQCAEAFRHLGITFWKQAVVSIEIVLGSKTATENTLTQDDFLNLVLWPRFRLLSADLQRGATPLKSLSGKRDVLL